MNCVDLYHCYGFDREWYLVEMVLNVPSSQIDWSGIVVPEEGVKESDRQCAYMEQYLNRDGTERICETYETPKEAVCPCRVAFFIYKTDSGLLHTPYGDFELDDTAETPTRLTSILDFDPES